METVEISNSFALWYSTLSAIGIVLYALASSEG